MFFTTFLRERLGYIAFLLFVLYFIFLIRSDVLQNSRFNSEKSRLIKDTELEKNRNTELKSKMNALGKASYVEQEAREKLGLIERGEKAYKVIIK